MSAALDTAGQDQSWLAIIPEKYLSTDRNAVSPLLLAFIHQFVGPLDEAFDRVIGVVHTRADRDGYTQIPVCILDFGLLDKGPDFFGHYLDPFQVDVEDQGQEFFATPASA